MKKFAYIFIVYFALASSVGLVVPSVYADEDDRDNKKEQREDQKDGPEKEKKEPDESKAQEKPKEKPKEEPKKEEVLAKEVETKDDSDDDKKQPSTPVNQAPVVTVVKEEEKSAPVPIPNSSTTTVNTDNTKPAEKSVTVTIDLDKVPEKVKELKEIKQEIKQEIKDEDKSVKDISLDNIKSFIAPLVSVTHVPSDSIENVKAPSSAKMDALIEITIRNVATSTVAKNTDKPDKKETATTTPVVGRTDPVVPDTNVKNETPAIIKNTTAQSNVASAVAFAPFQKVISYFSPSDYYSVEDDLSSTANVALITIATLIGIAGITPMATHNLSFKREEEVETQRQEAPVYG